VSTILLIFVEMWLLLGILFPQESVVYFVENISHDS
jgi:hypothetical protein